MKTAKLFTLLIFTIFLASVVSAAQVGVGISPSKVKLAAEAGKSQQMEFLLFNSGDADMEMQISMDGDLAEFTKLTPRKLSIVPEPKPHEQPIKNGKKFMATFSPPLSEETKTYTGTVYATAVTDADTPVKGQVGVAVQVELVAFPPQEEPAVSTQSVLLAILILLFLAILLFLKKSGLVFKQK